MILTSFSAHESSVWSLAWHPLGHILCSGSNDHTTKFWCRNRPGDDLSDKYNNPNAATFGDLTGIELPEEPTPDEFSIPSVPGLSMLSPAAIPQITPQVTPRPPPPSAKQPPYQPRPPPAGGAGRGAGPAHPQPPRAAPAQGPGAGGQPPASMMAAGGGAGGQYGGQGGRGQGLPQGYRGMQPQSGPHGRGGGGGGGGGYVISSPINVYIY